MRVRSRLRLTRVQGVIVTAGLLATAVMVMVVNQRVASAAPLRDTWLTTWNMQGRADGRDASKWTTTVSRYMQTTHIGMFQEVGPEPPGSTSTHHVDYTDSQGTTTRHEYVYSYWRTGTGRRERDLHVYFLQTDSNSPRAVGGRVNIAIVTGNAADELAVVTNPVAAGRRAIGVRMGEDWYFSFHGLSGGGGDSARMLDEISQFVGRRSTADGVRYDWHVAGDFNTSPGELGRRQHFPAHARIYSSGQATHQSGGELDYLVSSTQISNHPARRMDGAGSDHYAVRIAAMRAGAETRILAGGDSNTHGTNSSHGGGYRSKFAFDFSSFVSLDGLSRRSLDMVGGQSSGGFDDIQHEGVPGDRIHQIAARLAVAVPRYRPNVVLLLAGTNDLNGDFEVATAPGRLDALIDQVQRDSPGVTVVVGTLIPARPAHVQERIDRFNDAARGLVEQRAAAGQKVVLADLAAEMHHGHLSDDLHPHDAGYDLMADIFLSAVLGALADGLVTPPAPPQSGSGSGGAGFGRVDIGPFARVCTRFGGWVPRGRVATGTNEVDLTDPNGRRVDFADLDGDGRDEYLTIARRGGAMNVWWNTGPLTGREGWGWQPKGELASGVGDHVMFADLTGDRLEEYLVVDASSGAVWMWWNRGPHPQGGWWWEPIGKIAEGTGPNLRFGDLNGDGHDDYVQIEPGSGAVRVWWNGGPRAAEPTLDAGWHWHGDGQLVGEGVRPPAGSRVELADANGDAFDDYLVVAPNSSIRLWVRTGPGPHQWHEAGELAHGVGVAGGNVYLADLDPDRKVDYLALDNEGRADGWRNDCASHGTPGAACSRFHGGMWHDRRQVASGPEGVHTLVPEGPLVRFADLDGDGRDDYLTVGYKQGNVKTWWNVGPHAGPHGWDWEPMGQHAEGTGWGLDVRFADMDGDGRDDYLLVDRTRGSVRMWWNLGPGENGGWAWEEIGEIASGTGPNAQFGDLDGDGRDDYLQVDPATGAVEVWWNGGPVTPRPTRGGGWDWHEKGTLASGVQAQGHQVRFEDIDGDRDDDYLVIHDNSSVSAWLSGGHTEDKVGWLWYPVGIVAEGVGVSPGQVRLIHLNDDRRIDYLALDVWGRADGWINICS